MLFNGRATCWARATYGLGGERDRWAERLSARCWLAREDLDDVGDARVVRPLDHLACALDADLDFQSGKLGFQSSERRQEGGVARTACPASNLCGGIGFDDDDATGNETGDGAA